MTNEVIDRSVLDNALPQPLLHGGRLPMSTEDRFDELVEQAGEQGLSIEERREQLEERLSLEGIKQTLQEARRERKARYEQVVQRLENDDNTPEVLTDI